MPIVTSCPSRATSTASATQARNASASGMTWSAAKEADDGLGVTGLDDGGCDSRIAAIESRGEPAR